MDVLALALAHLDASATTDAQRAAVSAVRTAFDCEGTPAAFTLHSLATIVEAGANALGVRWARLGHVARDRPAERARSCAQ